MVTIDLMQLAAMSSPNPFVDALAPIVADKHLVEWWDHPEWQLEE